MGMAKVCPHDRFLNNIKKIVKKIEKEDNPLKVLARIRSSISPALFVGTLAKRTADISGPKEVILSEYLIGK